MATVLPSIEEALGHGIGLLTCWRSCKMKKAIDQRFVERVKVHITKIDALKNPRFPTSTWKEWKAGHLNTGSPPVHYELIGYLLRPIRLHESLIALRTERKGVQEFGIFCTTPVTSFAEGILTTQNSLYFVKIISTNQVKKKQTP